MPGKFQLNINQYFNSINGLCNYEFANTNFIKNLSFSDITIRSGSPSSIKTCIIQIVYYNYIVSSIECTSLTQLIKSTDYFIGVVKLNMFILFELNQRFSLGFEVAEYTAANPQNTTAIISSILSSILSIIITLLIILAIYCYRLRNRKSKVSTSSNQLKTINDDCNPTIKLKSPELKMSFKVKSPQRRVTNNMLLTTESGLELNSKDPEYLTISAGDPYKKKMLSCYEKLFENELKPIENQGNESIVLCNLCDKIIMTKDLMVNLLCDHTFHYNCINTYLIEKTDDEAPCPKCSKPIVREEKKENKCELDQISKPKKEESSKKMPSFLLMLKKRTRKLRDSKTIINLLDMKFGTGNLSKKKESTDKVLPTNITN